MPPKTAGFAGVLSRFPAARREAKRPSHSACGGQCGRPEMRHVRRQPRGAWRGPSATGSFAPAIAVFMSTPAAPSSIAMHASDAVPTPASTMTGTFACSMMIEMLFGILNSETRADRRAERHHGSRALLLETPADDRIVGRVGEDDEPFAHERPGRVEKRGVVGPERAARRRAPRASPSSRARPRARDAPCAPRRPRCSTRRCSAGASSPAGWSRAATRGCGRG